VRQGKPEKKPGESAITQPQFPSNVEKSRKEPHSSCWGKSGSSGWKGKDGGHVNTRGKVGFLKGGKTQKLVRGSRKGEARGKGRIG